MKHSVEVRLANGRELRIVTSYEPPPVPFRSCDWTAVDDRTYDGPGCPIGWGATEQQAIDDLLEQICNDENVCLPGCKACAMEDERP